MEWWAVACRDRQKGLEVAIEVAAASLPTFALATYFATCAGRFNWGTILARQETVSVGNLSLGRLSDFLGFRLRRVQNQLSRDFAAKTRAWGLRAGMFSALEIIAHNPGMSQIDLSFEVGLDKSAIVPLVDELEEKGWVARVKSPRDRRRNELSITVVGKEQLDLMFRELEITEQAGLAMLTAEERQIVSEALDKVYRAYVRGTRSS